MRNKFPIRNSLAVAVALCGAAIALAGCAVTLPPAPQNDPANANAPEAATASLRPTLVATSRSFLSPRAFDREQKAKQMDMSNMKMEETGMQHDMSGMQHGSMERMAGMHGISHESPASPALADSFFTCPMHSEIHEAKPGQCPKCGMKLVKKSALPEGAKP